MSNEAVESGEPDWVISWETDERGQTVFYDDDEPHVSLAVTSEELLRLESGLRLLPENEANAVLLDRLAGVRAYLDELSE